MQVVYAREPLPTKVSSSIFLAGPTPRSAAVASWRRDALELLGARGYAGTVFVPEPRDQRWSRSYLEQVDWELAALARADCIVFWIPRELEHLPGFTTNVEFGYWVRSGKCILAAPPGAPKLRYLDALAERCAVPRLDSLGDALDRALAILGDGAERQDGECDVPLAIFGSPSFQSWYRAQRGAGNLLEGARVEWVLRVVPGKDYLFYWALHVRVRVTAEGRVKKNEIVLARPDVAHVVLYRRDPHDLERSTVVLIREFRSPASSRDGLVHEHPGGSSFDADPDDMRAVAIAEVGEEIGLRIEAHRLRPIGVRQLAPTMSAHRAHAFAVELEAAELDALRADGDVVRGADAGERTTVELWTLAELLRDDRADWTTLGLAFAALSSGGS